MVSRKYLRAGSSFITRNTQAWEVFGRRETEVRPDRESGISSRMIARINGKSHKKKNRN